MHAWFAIHKKMTHRYFFTFLAIQEQHVVLSGKWPFYCWRTWGFRRRGRVRVGGFLWGWGERTTMKHPSTLWGKRSSNYFCTHFLCFTWKKHLRMSWLELFFAWKSMNINEFVPKKIDKVITYPNQQFWSFQVFLGGQNSSRMARIWRSSRVSLPSPPPCWHAAGRRSGRPENTSETPPKTSKTPKKKRGQFDLSSFWDMLRQLRILFFAFKAVMQLLRQQAEGGRTILDAVTCTSAITVTLAEKDVPKDHFEKRQF